jgi:hypothetical protein
MSAIVALAGDATAGGERGIVLEMDDLDARSTAEEARTPAIGRVLAFTLFLIAACSEPGAAEARLQFMVSPFLPVATASVGAQAEITPRLFWGVEVGAFYVLGRSVNAQLFLEPVYLRRGPWRLSGRLGVLAGHSMEFSFGPPPQQFMGIGAHLSPIEVAMRISATPRGRSLFVRLRLGLQVLTDFERLAASPHVGLGMGVAADE